MKLRNAAAVFGIASALTSGAASPALAVDDPAEEATDDATNDQWGLFGLLGLAGLAGLWMPPRRGEPAHRDRLDHRHQPFDRRLGQGPGGADRGPGPAGRARPRYTRS